MENRPEEHKRQVAWVKILFFSKAYGVSLIP